MARLDVGDQAAGVQLIHDLADGRPGQASPRGQIGQAERSRPAQGGEHVRAVDLAQQRWRAMRGRR